MGTRKPTTRVLDCMVETMDTRSMDRLRQAWNDWSAPRVQRPAIRRWLRENGRTHPFRLIAFLRMEQLREVCQGLGLEDEGCRFDLVTRILLEALVDDKGLAPGGHAARRYREEIRAMYEEPEGPPQITAQGAASLPQPFLSLVPPLR